MPWPGRHACEADGSARRLWMLAAAMAGRRRWGVIRKFLLDAAEQIDGRPQTFVGELQVAVGVPGHRGSLRLKNPIVAQGGQTRSVTVTTPPLSMQKLANGWKALLLKGFIKSEIENGNTFGNTRRK